MHDWTLLEVKLDWAECAAEIVLLDERSLPRKLSFKGVSRLSVDRREHWGPSSSVNEARWQLDIATGGVCLKIEMQSGGMIEVSATAVELDGQPYSPTMVPPEPAKGGHY